MPRCDHKRCIWTAILVSVSMWFVGCRHVLHPSQPAILYTYRPKHMQVVTSVGKSNFKLQETKGTGNGFTLGPVVDVTASQSNIWTHWTLHHGANQEKTRHTPRDLVARNECGRVKSLPASTPREDSRVVWIYSNTSIGLDVISYSTVYIQALSRTSECGLEDYWIIACVCVADTSFAAAQWVSIDIQSFRGLSKISIFFSKVKHCMSDSGDGCYLFAGLLNQYGFCLCISIFE